MIQIWVSCDQLKTRKKTKNKQRRRRLRRRIRTGSRRQTAYCILHRRHSLRKGLLFEKMKPVSLNQMKHRVRVLGQVSETVNFPSTLLCSAECRSAQIYGQKSHRQTEKKKEKKSKVDALFTIKGSILSHSTVLF